MVVFWLAVGIQIFGLPVEVDLTTLIIGILSLVMVLLMPFVVIVGISYDVQKQTRLGA